MAAELSAAERRLLRSLNQGGQLTHAQIARRARLSRPTVQRCLYRLRDAGWVKWEIGQHGNTYQVASGLSGPQSGASNDAPQSLTTSPSGKGDCASRNIPLHLQDRWDDRRWLAWFFESYARPTAKRRIDDTRRWKWARTAPRLLKHHRLCDIAKVLDWIFIKHGGVLPFAVTFTRRKGNHRFKVLSSSKVTNLWMVLDNWERIQEAMVIDEVIRRTAGGAWRPPAIGWEVSD
jgi:hypothetical protein